MRGCALSMNIAQSCYLETHDIIDNGVTPFISCIYMYLSFMQTTTSSLQEAGF